MFTLLKDIFQVTIRLWPF